MQLKIFKENIFLEVIEAKSRWIYYENVRVMGREEDFQHPNTLRMSRTDFTELMKFVGFDEIPDIPFFWGCHVVFDEKCYRPKFTIESRKQ